MKRLVRCVRDREAGFGMPSKPKTVRIRRRRRSGAAEATGWAAIISDGRRGDISIDGKAVLGMTRYAREVLVKRHGQNGRAVRISGDEDGDLARDG
jgi:hypothetical protein